MPPGLFVLFLLFLLMIVLFSYIRKRQRDLDRQRAAEASEKERERKKAIALKSPVHDYQIELENLNKKIDNLQNMLDNKDKEIKQKDQIIDDLRKNLHETKYGYKMIIDESKKKKEAYDSLSREYADLQDMYDTLEEGWSSTVEELKKLKNSSESSFAGYSAADITYMIEKISFLENEIAHSDHMLIKLQRNEAWEKLFGNRFHTLTPPQREKIHFPKVNPGCLYYLPSHKTFHAVYWCYALDQSSTSDIQEITLDEALQKGFKPCSKCISDEYYR